MIDELVRQRRGMVLENLRLQAGVPVAGALLQAAVAPWYGEESAALAVDLDYLIQARFVSRTESVFRGQKTRFYRITAEGYRVVEGAAVDAGVAPPAVPVVGV